MENQINYNDWISRIIKEIGNISDSEYQKRVWIEGKGPEVDSFDEAMCMIIDTNAFEYFTDEYLSDNYPENKLVNNEYMILKDMLQSFNPPDEMPDEEKIAQPDWKAIMAQAAKVLELSRNSPLAAYMPKK